MFAGQLREMAAGDTPLCRMGVANHGAVAAADRLLAIALDERAGDRKNHVQPAAVPRFRGVAGDSPQLPVPAATGIGDAFGTGVRRAAATATGPYLRPARDLLERPLHAREPAAERRCDPVAAHRTTQCRISVLARHGDAPGVQEKDGGSIAPGLVEVAFQRWIRV